MIALPSKLADLDWKLIFAALALSLIGILLIYSSQYYSDEPGAQSYYLKQSVWLFAALIVFSIIISLPPRFYDLVSYLFYSLMIVMLVAVLVLGSKKMGAARWFSVGPFNFQPSELGKVALLLALARFLAYTKLPLESFRRLLISFVLTAVPVILILREPDLGTSLVYVGLLFSLWFYSGLSPLYLVLIISPFVSLVAAFHWVTWAAYFLLLLLLLFMARPGLLFGVVVTIINLGFGMLTPLFWNRLADYQRERILTFLDPGRDPRGAGYQIIQSIIAIGSGGLFGQGFLGGSQTRLEFLPVRHTDFVFSVLGDEFGLLGGIIVLGLFGYIFYRGLRIATRCRSRYLGTIAWGAVTIIFFQMFVNVGMTLGLMPVTGLPLPFMSYGGSSLVFFWILIGLLVLADKHWQEY
jgi:rod shape determining protein RodA